MNYYKGLIILLAIFSILNTVLTGFFYDQKNLALFELNNLSYTPIEFILIAFLIKGTLKEASNKKLIFISMPVFLVAWGLILLSMSSNNFDSAAVALEEIFLLSFCLLYYYENLKSPEQAFIYTTNEFWVVTAILIYSSSTFFVYLFRETNWQNLAFREQYDYIHLNASIFKNLFFSISVLIRHGKTTKFLNS